MVFFITAVAPRGDRRAPMLQSATSRRRDVQQALAHTDGLYTADRELPACSTDALALIEDGSRRVQGVDRLAGFMRLERYSTSLRRLYTS